MKFVVAYDIRSCANLCGSPTKVFGEHRNLSNVEGFSDTEQLDKIKPTSCMDMSDKKVTMLPDTETTSPDSSAFFPDITLTWSPPLNRFLTLRAGT
jgi:hypothetical protein